MSTDERLCFGKLVQSFDGKPQASAKFGKTVACGLPFNDWFGLKNWLHIRPMDAPARCDSTCP